MTIEQLLELPPEGLEALSDEQLVEILGKYFKFTRPQNTGMLLPSASTTQRKPRAAVPSQKAIANAFMEKMLDPNLSIDDIKKMKTLIQP